MEKENDLSSPEQKGTFGSPGESVTFQVVAAVAERVPLHR